MTNSRWMTVWTDEMKARLAIYWAGGMPVTKIGLAMSREFDVPLSRNAVVGKAMRMGLKKRESPIKPKKKNARGGKGLLEKVRARTAKKEAERRAKPSPPPPWVPKVVYEPIPATSEARQCRWYLGDVRPVNPLPGQPVYHRWADVPRCTNERHGDKSWCLKHCHMAFTNFGETAE